MTLDKFACDEANASCIKCGNAVETGDGWVSNHCAKCADEWMEQHPDRRFSIFTRKIGGSAQ